MASVGRKRAAWAVAVTVAVAALHQGIDTASLAESGRLHVPSPARVKALALGFEPVVADYYWIQALQIVGSRTRKSGDNAVVRELVDVVTTVDPWVDHPYRFAALWLDQSAEEVRYANSVLERGIAYHPDDWRNRFYLGYNHFFHLGDNERAAQVLETALAFDGAPDYLGALVTRLKASSDSLDSAVLFLQQLIAGTEDGYERAEYGKAFDEIETERRARFLDGAREEFRRRHGRDLRAVEELWSGPLRVISGAPPAHPHFPDFVWELDGESGEIVSSFYGARYRLRFHAADLERQRRWTEGDEDPEEDVST